MNALVSIRDGEVRASSQDVAAAFDKAHKDVLRAINNLIELAPQISRRNFAPSNFVSRGKTYPAYEMDRDGFSLLAMGFTGAKALEWKLKFLEAFRRMEEALQASLSANDNGLAGLHPLLQTADGRDAIGRGMEQVRRLRELRGPDAALAMWRALGLPLPADLEDYSLPALERSIEKVAPERGELFQWIQARRVAPDPAKVTHLRVLWDSYLNWCAAEGLAPYSKAKFQWHLNNHFEKDKTVGSGTYRVGLG